MIEKYLAPPKNGTLPADNANLDHTWLAYITGLDENIGPSRTDQRTWDVFPDHQPFVELDPDLLISLGSYLDSKGVTLHRWVRVHPRFSLAGVQYSRSSANARECCIFFDPNSALDSDTLIPGLIREIVSVVVCLDKSIPKKYLETFYFIVQRFKPVGHDQLIMSKFPLPRPQLEDFRASLWSQEMLDAVDILPLTGKICQGIYRPWNDTSFVMRGLDKVRIP